MYRFFIGRGGRGLITSGQAPRRWNSRVHGVRQIVKFMTSGTKTKQIKKQRPKSKPPLYHQRYKPRQSANRTGRGGPDPGEWRARRGELTEVSGPTSLRWVVKCILCDIKKTEAGRLFTHLERFTPGAADLVKRQSEKTNADKAEDKPPAPHLY